MAKVLFIEDDKDQIDLYRVAFKTYAPDIEYVGERYAKEVLEKISTIRPDVILLDIIMPDMDGVQVLKKLKKMPEAKHVPVIVFTNSTKFGLFDICKKLGAKEILEKTRVEPKGLVERIKSICI